MEMSYESNSKNLAHLVYIYFIKKYSVLLQALFNAKG